MATAATLKADFRRQLRGRGYRPIEVWLPDEPIQRIDALRADNQLSSRNQVIMELVTKSDTLMAGGPGVERSEAADK